MDVYGKFYPGVKGSKRESPMLIFLNGHVDNDQGIMSME